MKVSIITPVYNGGSTIEDTILSVASQEYKNIEHIIVDGSSTDNTLKIINKHHDKIAVIVSEPDNGLYEAVNKGIRHASGDVIGILNSDDLYFDTNCLGLVVNTFLTKNVDAVYSDLVFVSHDNIDKVVRYYRSKSFNTGKFAWGMMPAHPTFFTYKKCYDKIGLYRTDYKIAADFELMVRFLKIHKISFYHLDKVLVKMRKGGISNKNFKSNWLLNKEVLKACQENNISTNIFKVWLKYFVKFFQLLERPKIKAG